MTTGGPLRFTRRLALRSAAATALAATIGNLPHLVAQEVDVSPNAAPPDIDDYLRMRQREQLAALRATWDALRTDKQLQEYQRRVRAEFLELLGPFPDRSAAPNVVAAGRLVRDGYVIEKGLLESQQGFWTPFNLYVPENAKQAPAVLCPVGHAPSGKAHRERDSYQSLFITLARAGFVVCAFDPLGQGEREPYGAATGNHHAIQGVQCLSSARHLSSYFLFDALRCLDYLAERPEVDSQRIGCAGCSGGGAVTQYLAAIDERVRVAVPASWITTTQVLTEDDGLHVESWLPRLATPHGAGTLQLLACIAPRPLLILGNHDDAEFPPGPMQSVFRETRALYERVGAAEAVEYADTPTRHGFWPATRLEAYRFLAQHLLPPDRRPTLADWQRLEAKVEPEDEASLACAPRGQVRNITGAKTVFDLNREELGKLRRERLERRAEGKEADWETHVRRGLRQLIPDRPLPRRATAELLGEGKTRDVPFRRFLVTFDATESLWIDIYAPPARPPQVTFVMADEMSVGAARAAALRAAGQAVWHVHGFRGRERREYMVGEYRAYRWARLLVAAARTPTGWPGEGVPQVERLVGIGVFAAWAAQLAPIVEEIYEAERSDAGHDHRLAKTSVVTSESMLSLAAVCDDVAATHTALIVPGQWRWFDETDVAMLLGSRRLWIADARDPRQRAVGREAMERHYDWVSRRRERQGAALRLSDGAPSIDELVAWRDGGG